MLLRQNTVLNQVSSSGVLIEFFGESINLAFHNQLQLKVAHSQVLHGALQTDCVMMMKV